MTDKQTQKNYVVLCKDSLAAAGLQLGQGRGHSERTEIPKIEKGTRAKRAFLAFWRARWRAQVVFDQQTIKESGGGVEDELWADLLVKPIRS